MKILLTVAFVVTTLYACGGEFQLQDKAAADKAPITEQRSMKQAAVEKNETNNKQAADTAKETTELTATEIKTDSAIKMVMGVARSMF